MTRVEQDEMTAARSGESTWARINRPAEIWQVRWMAAICFASAGLQVFGSVFPYKEIEDEARRWAASGITVAAGAAYWLLAPFFRVWMLHGIVTVGFAWGCLGLAGTPNPVAAALTLSTLLWTSVFVGAAFRPTVARVYGLLLWAGMAIAIAISGIPGGAAIAVAFGASFLVIMEILSRATSRLRLEASTDPLTGLLNRKGLTDGAVRAFAAAERGEPVAVIHVDIDNFKNVNDTKGHFTGDRLLVEMADAWRTASRRGDFIGRFGGDEFVAVLPGASRQAAGEVRDRLREVSPAPWSAGIAIFEPGDTIESCLARADLELYEEKAAKNRTGRRNKL